MFPGRSFGAPAIFVALAANSQPSVAAEAAECQGFCWSAPESCPSEETVLTRIRSLSDSTATPPEGFSASVSQDGDRWTVELSHEGQRRVIAAASCADVSEATAVAVALALAPRNPDESQNAAADFEAAPDRVSAPTRDSVTAVDPVERIDPDVATPDRAETGVIEPEPASAAPLARGPFFLAAAVWEPRVLPSATWGARLGAGLPFFRVLSASGHATLFTSVRTPVDESLSAGSVDYRLVGGGASVCWQPPVLDPFSGCAGAEAAWLAAEAPNLVDGQSRSSFFPALTMAAKVAPGWRALGFEFGVEAAVPLLRDRFTVDQQRELHRTPAWTVRGVAGLTVSPF